MKNTLIIASLSLTLSASAHAGGFILNDHGASATGRANAVTATVDDGSAIFYNPAGLAAAEGRANIYLGSTLILPFASFTEGGTNVVTDAERPNTVTPHIYGYGKVLDFLTVGVGFYTPFGSSTEWPETSPGRDQSRKTTLRTFFISPVVAVDLSTWVPGKLTIGGGIDLVPSDVELTRDILFGDVAGTAVLGGDAFGIGGRIGVQWDPAKQVSIGVAYRSEVTLDFEGNGDFDIADPFRASLPPDGPIATTVTLPQSVLAGVAGRPVPELELEFNLQWVDWTSFDTQVIDLPDGSQSITPRNWDDKMTLRFGAEYWIRPLGLSVRGGYAYDPTPIPDETLGFAPPDANRNNLYLGGSYGLPKNFHIDVGLLWGLPVSNKTAVEPFMPQVQGEFDISFFVAALSLGYTFEDKEE
jgi:long-chain fatty acid transport protein